MKKIFLIKILIVILIASCEQSEKQNDKAKKKSDNSTNTLKKDSENNVKTKNNFNWRNPVMNSFGANLGQYIRAYYMVGEFDKIRDFLHYPECFKKDEIDYILRNCDWGYKIDFTNIKWQADSTFIMSYKVFKNNTTYLEQYKGLIVNDTAKLFFFPNNSTPFRYSGKDDFDELCNLKTALKNVNFKFNSSEILPDSKPALNKILLFFQRNNNQKAIIVGHTSSEGSKDFNMKLSKMRAKAIYDYLVNNGINQSNLSYDGRGDNEPFVPNNTEENRVLNRRVVINFIDND